MNKQSHGFQLLITIFLILWFNAGNFVFISEYIPQAVKYGLVILWFLIACIYEKTFLSRVFSFCWPLLVFLIVMLAANLMGRNHYYDQFFVLYVGLFVLTSIGIYYCQFGSYSELKAITVVFLADFFVVAIRTFVELFTNPVVARAMGTSAIARAELLNGVIPKGVGGYGLCYQFVFLGIIMPRIFRRYNVPKVLRVIFYVFSFVLLFKAQITIPLILFTGTLFIDLLTHNDGKSNKVLAARIAGFIILIVLVANFEAILSVLISKSDADLANRLSEILNIISNKQISVGDRDTSARIRLYTMSLDYFFQNPVTGLFGNGGYGSHSTFFDMLGSFGLFSIFGIAGLLKPLFGYKKMFGESWKGNFSWLMLFYIVFSITNPSIGNDIVAVVFTLIPIICRMDMMRSDIYENS